MFLVTAGDVKNLRMKTGAPMMDCKRALLECKGNMDEAADWLRKKGIETSDKKAGRETKSGLVGFRIFSDNGVPAVTFAEVKCETDFVARNPLFQDFVRDTARNGMDLEKLPLVISKVGENIQFGRYETVSGGNMVLTYIHNKMADDLGTIAVAAFLEGEPTPAWVAMGKDVAMHIAAMNPKAVDVDSLDPDFVENERRIEMEKARESGKPENIIEKMVEGRLKKMLRETTLVNQNFVKDPMRTVFDVLSEHNAKVVKFIRVEVGE